MAVALYSEAFQEFQMNKWLSEFWKKRTMTFALIGDRTSIGGSFLKNILGEDHETFRADISDLIDPMDMSSESLSAVDAVVGGVYVTATLIPALSDASGYKDEGYFRRVIMDVVKRADLVIYCVDMSGTRIRGSVLRTLQELKPDWSRTVIALTFADALPALMRHRDNPSFPKGQYFNTKLAEWAGELKAMLKRIGVRQKEVGKIKVCPVADEPDDFLPNGEPWLAPLSLAIMEILSPKKKAAFVQKHAKLLPTVTAAAKQPPTLSSVISTAAEVMVTMHVSTTTEVQSSSDSDLQASSISSMLSEDQSRSIRAALTKLRKDCPVFAILVIGRTGVGKSTLINNLVGKEVANVGHTLQSETPEVKPHEDSVEGVPIVVYDTPGLGDVKGDEEEKLHLEIMKDFMARKNIHLVVYCFQMNETIMTSSLNGALRKYHQIGVDWERVIIALTFADALYSSKSEQKYSDFTMCHFFNKRLKFWQAELKMELMKPEGHEHDWRESYYNLKSLLLSHSRLAGDSDHQPDSIGMRPDVLEWLKFCSTCLPAVQFLSGVMPDVLEWLRFWSTSLRTDRLPKSDVVERLKICPTSLLPKDQLPNGNPWYVPLWLHIVEVLSPAATVRFLDIHRNNICNEQTQPPSNPAKVEVKLVGEYKQQFAVTVAATVEAAGMDSGEKSTLLATITKASIGAIGNWLNSSSEQSVTLPPQDTAGPNTATSADSPQNQTLSVKESILSQNVYERHDHLVLLRKHVSRKAAGKGRAVLEGVGLDTTTIRACIHDNSRDEEEAVQEGLTKWIEGKGRQPPTWKILFEVMDFAGIAQQHAQNLKKDLGLW